MPKIASSFLGKYFITGLVAGGLIVQLALLGMVYQTVIGNSALAQNVDDRLTFLESTIVGACPDDTEIPDGAKCRQGFHRQQARAVIAELCRVNNLECVNITDEWPQ